MNAHAAYCSDSHATTVHDRFSVTCTFCEDVVGTFQTMREAFLAANREARQHPDAADKVQVYDAMARRNRAELWSADGTVIRRREGK